MSEAAKKILVIDDEAELAELVAEQLTDFGFETLFCDSVKKARAHMSDKSFDAIVTDIQMPYETGVDFAESVRNSNNLIPIIFVSGFTNHVRDRIVGIQKSFILDKPIDMDNLIDLVARVTSSK